MKKGDIEVGGEYLIGSMRHSGRARVIGLPTQRRKLWSSERPPYIVPVEFPDSIKDGKPERKDVETKDFSRLWSSADEDDFCEYMETESKMEEIEKQLLEVGIEVYSIRWSRNGKLSISFIGADADLVIERLTSKKIES